MFSSTVMDHFYNPRNVGSPPNANGSGQAGSVDQGRFIRISLVVEAGRITLAQFKTFGCVPAIAAGSCLTEWVVGLTVDEARFLSPQNLIDKLGGLPPRRMFCACMAIEALQNALDDAQRRAA